MEKFEDEIDIKPKCFECRAELSKKHMEALKNAFSGKKLFGDHLRNIKPSDYVCEKCWEDMDLFNIDNDKKNRGGES